MLEIAINTVKLLRRNPVLWVPATLALLLDLGVQQGHRSVARAIADWLIPRSHDALFGTSYLHGPPTQATIAEVTSLAFLLTALSSLIQTAIGIASLVAIANIIDSSQTAAASDFRDALRAIRARARGIRFVTVAVVSFYMLNVALQSVAMKVWNTRDDFQQTPFWHLQALHWVMILAMYAAIVLIVAPWALDLAHNAEAGSLLNWQYQQARVFVGIALAVWTGLEYAWVQSEHALAQNYEGFRDFVIRGFVPISALLTAAILTFLFTAFWRIAHPEQEETLAPTS